MNFRGMLAGSTIAAVLAVPLETLAGQTAKDSWLRSGRVGCQNEGQPDLTEVGFVCGGSPALELPYVRGLGWADEAKPHVLLDLDPSAGGATVDKELVV